MYRSLLANALLAKKDYPGAEAAYRQAIELKPKVASMHKYLANAYAADYLRSKNAAQKAAAISEYQAYLQARPVAPDRDAVMTSLRLLQGNAVARPGPALD